MATKGNNIGNKFIALFFLLAAIAEYFFWSAQVGKIKYILWGISIIAALVLTFNTEDPIQPGKFYGCVIAGLACLVIVLALNSTAIFG